MKVSICRVSAYNFGLIIVIQGMAKGALGPRLTNMEQDYISFLYGWNALSKKPERTSLSVDDPAVFQNVDLANTFFR